MSKIPTVLLEKYSSNLVKNPLYFFGSDCFGPHGLDETNGNQHFDIILSSTGWWKGFCVILAGHDLVTDNGRDTLCGCKLKTPSSKKKRKMKDLPKNYRLKFELLLFWLSTQIFDNWFCSIWLKILRFGECVVFFSFGFRHRTRKRSCFTLVIQHCFTDDSSLFHWWFIDEWLMNHWCLFEVTSLSSMWKSIENMDEALM